jgi:DNA-binding response OmpR family regulator
LDGKIILVVEDDLITAMEIVHFLKKAGYNPIHANSSEQALNKVKVIQPELIIMNVRLHGKDEGPDTIKKIKKTVKVPVIYLTAHTEPEILRAVEMTKPSACIKKPFDWKELVSLIEEAVGKGDRNEMEHVTGHGKFVYKFYAMVGTSLATSTSRVEGDKFLSSFGNCFERNLKTDFITKVEEMELDMELKCFDSYLICLSQMLSNLGFLNKRICNETSGYMVINSCPWKYGECSNNIFCKICDLLSKRTFSWMFSDGNVSQESTIINGDNFCGFKFELNE